MMYQLEDVIIKGVEAMSAWAEGFVSCVEEWEAKFAFASGEKYPRWESV